MPTESELRQKLLDKLALTIPNTYNIDKEVPIPYKHIYLPTKPPQLEIWGFKQDIAIFKTLFPKDVERKGSKVTWKQTDILNVIVRKDTSQHSHDFGLPFVIIETKKKQPTTDVILAYSKKAEMIKSIFPYCKYIFLIFGHIAPRTYRNDSAFDLITSLHLSNKGEVDNFIQQVKALLRQAEKEWKLLEESK